MRKQICLYFGHMELSPPSYLSMPCFLSSSFFIDTYEPTLVSPLLVLLGISDAELPKLALFSLLPYLWGVVYACLVGFLIILRTTYPEEII